MPPRPASPRISKRLATRSPRRIRTHDSARRRGAHASARAVRRLEGRAVELRAGLRAVRGVAPAAGGRAHLRVVERANRLGLEGELLVLVVFRHAGRYFKRRATRL